MENKKIYITMYGYTLLIAIIINSLIEYKDYINKLIPIDLITIVLLFTISVSIICITIKYKTEFNKFTDPIFIVIMTFILIIFIWTVIIKVIFIMNPIASIISILIIIMLIMSFILFATDDSDDRFDISIFIVPSLLLLCISFLIHQFHPKTLETYNTTHNQVYIQKEKWFDGHIYEIYDTSIEKKSRYNMYELNYKHRDIFARYILKHINKDLKVDVTMYDESTYTYKIMYEDGTIQKFALSDIKSDDEFKNNSIINKFLSEKEAEKSAKLAEQKLENQKETLKNS